eukprot:TRINITY_DN184_c0_g1_i1.p2 TRINITY_DN184_c0_g1~~TRINITY_DN184_c0_g1_i1.p2  ORF type:complete len:121 (-),score=46.09 TRINITY_DN184_c0_g1_i1:349-711(-)
MLRSLVGSEMCIRDRYGASRLWTMIFYSFFLNAMMGKTVTVELKNDLMVKGTLSSVDQYLNVKLDQVKTQDEDAFPHLMSVNNCFIRGSVIRYIHLPKHEVNTEMLQDATRRENKDNAQK